MAERGEFIMKRPWNMLAAGCCVALIAAGCTAAVQGTVDKNEASQGSTQTKEHERQCNLDVIYPMAYSNVDGLTLEPGTRISIIGRGSSSPYWSEIKAGAERAVEDMNNVLGYKGDDKITIVYSSPQTETDVDDQVNILDEELARYPSAVGIAAVDSGACEVQFDLAAENQIPIVVFDSGTNYPNIMSMVDTNNLEAARTAASKLCDSIGGHGDILLLAHDSKSTSAQKREEGFVKAIEEEHPEVKVTATYRLDELEDMQKSIAEEQSGGENAQGREDEPASEDSDAPEPGEEAETKETAETLETSGAGESETPEQGEPDEKADQDKAAEPAELADPETIEPAEDMTQEDVVRYLLEKNPDIKGIFATNEAAAKLAVSVLEEMDRDDIKIISFDGGKDQLKLLEEGKLEGLIVQNPYGMGYATVVACARAILEQPNEAEVNTGYVWVTRDNLEQEAISRMMY